MAKAPPGLSVRFGGRLRPGLSSPFGGCVRAGLSACFGGRAGLSVAFPDRGPAGLCTRLAAGGVMRRPASALLPPPAAAPQFGVWRLATAGDGAALADPGPEAGVGPALGPAPGAARGLLILGGLPALPVSGTAPAVAFAGAPMATAGMRFFRSFSCVL